MLTGMGKYGRNIFMKSVDNVDSNTKASRVAKSLAEDIRQGKFESGILLPAEETLGERYSVTRKTMRKSLAILSQHQQILKLPQGGAIIPGIGTADGEYKGKKTERELSIATVWSTIPDGHQIEISEGIETYARDHKKIQLRTMFSAQGYKDAIHLLTHIETSQWDGIIIEPYQVNEYLNAVRNLVEKGFPVVCVDRRIEGLPVSSIQVCNTAGIYRATRYLIDKYHRPAYLLTCKIEQPVVVDRYEGFRHAMADSGYDQIIQSHTFEMEISETDPQYWPVEKKWLPGFLLAERFFPKAAFPVSVVCSNDNTARGVYEAAAKAGLKIGADIAVASFDDLPMAKLMKPALTTVHQPRKQMGYEAAKLLHRLILGKDKPPQHIHLPVELIVRESA
jgi:DNA-binding LacI/PurR family transcriptional regulator